MAKIYEKTAGEFTAKVWLMSKCCNQLRYRVRMLDDDGLMIYECFSDDVEIAIKIANVMLDS